MGTERLHRGLKEKRGVGKRSVPTRGLKEGMAWVWIVPTGILQKIGPYGDGKLLFMRDVVGDGERHTISTEGCGSIPIRRLRSFVYHLFLPTGRVRGGRG